MIVGGGQMGLALGYALAPLAIGAALKHPLGAGVILAFQIMFDPRIALLTLIAMVFLAGLKKTFGAGFLGLLPHLFWLLPTLAAKRELLPAGLSESGWLGFLSVAEFSKTLALLHPNWPENIFGKTYLMRPGFLVLPILAYAFLLFNPKSKTILLFALLGLIGAFLAKGVNPPAGFIYAWLFENIPGWQMFRDPTKFYFLVVLAYSFLVPYTLEAISLKVRLSKK